MTRDQPGNPQLAPPIAAIAGDLQHRGPDLAKVMRRCCSLGSHLKALVNSRTLVGIEGAPALA
jgi:hypothetical protein